jgi:proteic killer suppression protein
VLFPALLFLTTAAADLGALALLPLAGAPLAAIEPGSACLLFMPCVTMCCMIKSFRDREAERLFQRRLFRRLPGDIQHVAYRKLVQLDAATRLETLRIPPGNRLEALSGNRRGQYSIRINDRWRICFVWTDGDAYDVEIVDYH